jgi:hypothetical protein
MGMIRQTSGMRIARTRRGFLLHSYYKELERHHVRKQNTFCVRLSYYNCCRERTDGGVAVSVILMAIFNKTFWEELKCRLLSFECFSLYQGGPTFFPESRIVFLLDPRAKKPLLALIFTTNSQFLLSLVTLIQKWQITIVYAQIKMLFNYYRVRYYFKFALATACIWHNFYLENLHFL